MGYVKEHPKINLTKSCRVSIYLLIDLFILRGDCKPYPHNVKLVNF